MCQSYEAGLCAPCSIYIGACIRTVIHFKLKSKINLLYKKIVNFIHRQLSHCHGEPSHCQSPVPLALSESVVQSLAALAASCSAGC